MQVVVVLVMPPLKFTVRPVSHVPLKAMVEPEIVLAAGAVMVTAGATSLINVVLAEPVSPKLSVCVTVIAFVPVPLLKVIGAEYAPFVQVAVLVWLTPAPLTVIGVPLEQAPAKVTLV